MMAQTHVQNDKLINSFVISLEDHEQEQLMQIHKISEVHFPKRSFEEFYLEATLGFHKFPMRIRKSCITFARKGSAYGVLFIKGFPVEKTLLTPSCHLSSPKWSEGLAEFWMSAVASSQGVPVGYAHEKNHQIFQDFFPTPESMVESSTESANISLDFHTEISFHRQMISTLLLYTLRQDMDQTARIIFALVREAIPLLAANHIAELSKRQFRISTDKSSEGSDESKDNRLIVPVLYGNRSDPFLRFDLNLMQAESKAGTDALLALREALNLIKRDVPLETGSMLLIDNRRTVHTRPEFKGYFDSRGCWFKRMAICRDLDASIHDWAPSSRIVATDFATYLETTAQHFKDKGSGRQFPRATCLKKIWRYFKSFELTPLPLGQPWAARPDDVARFLSRNSSKVQK